MRKWWYLHCRQPNLVVGGYSTRMNEEREKEREKEKKEGVGGQSDVKDGAIGGSGDCVATHRQQKEIQRWEEQRLLEKRKKKKKMCRGWKNGYWQRKNRPKFGVNNYFYP